MKTWEKNRLEIYLLAITNDLERYLENPQDFQAEYFEDVKECAREALNLIGSIEVQP
jgi:hypothetical protein